MMRSEVDRSTYTILEQQTCSEYLLKLMKLCLDEYARGVHTVMEPSYDSFCAFLTSVSAMHEASC